MKSKERIIFENHENPYKLKWKTVQYRMTNGESFEEAIGYPPNGRKSKSRCKSRN